MRPAIGTYEWNEQYCGTLTPREKVQMILWVVRMQVQDVWERSLFGQPRLRQKHKRVNLDRIRVPDTVIVKDAHEYVSRLYTPPLLNHCYRVYFWGCLLAQADELHIDPELFMVASLFHDIGVTDEMIGQAHHCCFTTTGGRVASSFVTSRGWTEQRSRRLYEAISLHLNPYIDPNVHGAEESLVGAAASLDLLGMQRQRIPLTMIRRVHAAYERSTLLADMTNRTDGARHRSDTRARFYASMGAKSLLQHNPLEREEYQEQPDHEHVT